MSLARVTSSLYHVIESILKLSYHNCCFYSHSSVALNVTVLNARSSGAAGSKEKLKNTRSLITQGHGLQEHLCTCWNAWSAEEWDGNCFPLAKSSTRTEISWILLRRAMPGTVLNMQNHLHLFFSTGLDSTGKVHQVRIGIFYAIAHYKKYIFVRINTVPFKMISHELFKMSSNRLN